MALKMFKMVNLKKKQKTVSLIIVQERRPEQANRQWAAQTRFLCPFQAVSDLPPRELYKSQHHGHPACRGHDLGNHTVTWHLVVILLLR